MGFGNRGDFAPVYFLHDNLNAVVEEKGNVFLALRKVQWAKAPDSPKDPERAKLELRKWIVSPEGERPSKGITFMTEEGPHNCVTTLIEQGYGHTKEVLLKLKEREDFRESVENLYSDSDGSDADGEYFDARELLLND